MPLTAAFRTTAHATSERIDSAAGVIYGCQLVKDGKTARFMGAKGQPEEIDITPELIKSLAALAEGRTFSAHWTHDWRGDEKDPLAYKIGAWKNIRIDSATGNLIGDLHLMPSEYREAVLWLADNTPDGAMMSIVFSYERINDRHARPVEFYGADLVETGAGSEAFFSQSNKQTNKPMDLKELTPLLVAALAAPEVKSVLRAAFAEEKGTEDEDKKKKEEDDKKAEDAALAAEKEAGVIEADQKPSDAALSAPLRAAVRISRAAERKSNEKIAAMSGTLKVEAEAAVVAKIGSMGRIDDKGGNIPDNKKQHAFLAKVKEHEATGVSASKALLRAQNDHPDLYNDYMKTKGIFQQKA